MTSLIGSASQRYVRISDQSSAGECRRAAKELASAWGFDEVRVGRIGIVASEVATNIARHVGDGLVLLQVIDDASRPELEILGIDQGAGMSNVQACMRDGYSTSGTAGTGLGAILRLSDTFDIFSVLGKGTVVLSRTAMRSTVAAPSSTHLEFGAISVALAGEIECGDCWRVAQEASRLSLMVADGLGHGPLAAVASKAVAASFASNPFDQPSQSMRRFHGAASGTRGTAAACALLDARQQKIDYAGVGNISAGVVDQGRFRGMVSHNGTLGVQLLRTQQFEYPWPARSHVIMHSDGLSARWDLSDYPGLMQHHPAIVAGVLYRDFRRERDDATVLVARVRA